MDNMEKTNEDPYPGVLSSGHLSAWQLAKAYWRSEQRFPVYFFFSLVVLLTFAFVSLDAVFNYYYYHYYEVLQYSADHGVARILLVAGMLTAFYLLFAGFRYSVTYIFGVRCRHWLRKHASHLFSGFGQKTERLNSHVQKDLDALINYSIDLSIGLIGVLTTFWVMIYILWLLSGDLNVSLGRFGTYALPGYLAWLGIIYAIAWTFFSVKGQKDSLLGRLIKHVSVTLPQRHLTLITMAFYHISVVLPLIFVLPGSLDKIFLLSWLLQSLQAFNRVQHSLEFTVKRLA